MVVPSAKARKIIFIVGFALIIVGGIGLAVLHDLWLNIVTSIFTVSGTTMSFAQFALGFGTIKPQDTPTPAPAPIPVPVTQPSIEPVATLTAPNDTIPLGTTQIAIGRAPDNQHIIHDPQASGYHAIIHTLGQGYTITDLGSTNGTYVNGQRLTANVPCTLNPGDTIRIGTTSFTYQVKQASAIAKTIPATEPHYQQGTPSYGASPAYAPPPPPAYDGATPKYVQPTYAAAPNYAPPAPMYAPPPPQGSLYRPAWQQQRLYRRSGIALLLTGACYLVQLFLLLGPKTPDTSQTFESFVILAYICLLFALRGLHARQEHKTGWLGTIGLMMLTAGAIINILIAGIFVGNYIPGYSFSQIVSTTIVTLSYVNLVFLVSGDILYGISMIRANVYPRWTGVVLIIVGFLNPVALVPQSSLAISLLASLLLIAFLTRLGFILVKQPPQPQQQFVH